MFTNADLYVPVMNFVLYILVDTQFYNKFV